MSEGIRTITEQIYHLIREDILQQKLKMGEKLTVKMLQEKLGVSSTPIREALTRLQQDGLIEYQPNVGMRVINMDLHDLEEVFQMMGELDCIAVRLACQSPQREEMLRQLTELQVRAEACLDSGDLATWAELSDQFHLAFYQFCGNSRLCSAAERIRLQFGIFSNSYQKVDANSRGIQRDHVRVIECLKHNQDELAIQVMREHAQASMKRAMDYMNEAQETE